VVIASNITGNSQMSIMMALEESRNHSISRLCLLDDMVEEDISRNGENAAAHFAAEPRGITMK